MISCMKKRLAFLPLLLALLAIIVFPNLKTIFGKKSQDNGSISHWAHITKLIENTFPQFSFSLSGPITEASSSSAEATEKVVSHEEKRIFFLVGNPSHRSGEHEFRAGSILLANALNEQADLAIQAEVISGWPQDDSVLNGASALVIYCDSDSLHREHYNRLMELAKAGAGLFFMHYGVHPQKAISGQTYYMPTVGGFMEKGFSVNPIWAAELNTPSNHPIRRGCEKPIKAFDEFYYNLRFHEKSFPLLTGIPTEGGLIRTNLWNENGENGLNKPQTIMWGFENEKGIRGGGFTGGHYHRNWAIDDFRKAILNTIVWIAGFDVPEGGVKSKKVTEEMINANLDQKKKIFRVKLPLKSPMEYYRETKKSRSGGKKRNKK